MAVTAIPALALALSHNAFAQQPCADNSYNTRGYKNKSYENSGYHGGGYDSSGYDNPGNYDTYNYGRGRSGSYDRGRSGMDSGMGSGMGSGSGYGNRAYGYDRGYQRLAPPANRYGAPGGSPPRGGYYAPRYPAQVQDSAIAEQAIAPSEVDVRIAGMQYSPAPLKVRIGEQVVWQNADGMPHTVTSSDGGPLDSGQLAKGNTYSFTFTEPGTYEYYCTYHPSMRATVIVE